MEFVTNEKLTIVGADWIEHGSDCYHDGLNS